VAVSYSPGLARLREEFPQAPLFKRTGIQIALVHQDGNVEGLAV